jgi:hypothetical protein
MRLTRIIHHRFGRFAFRLADRLRDHGIDHQSIAVACLYVAHKAQFAGGLAFAIQPGITVRL